MRLATIAFALTAMALSNPDAHGQVSIAHMRSGVDSLDATFPPASKTFYVVPGGYSFVLTDFAVDYAGQTSGAGTNLVCQIVDDGVTRWTLAPRSINGAGNGVNFEMRLSTGIEFESGRDLRATCAPGRCSGAAVRAATAGRSIVPPPAVSWQRTRVASQPEARTDEWAAAPRQRLEWRVMR